MHLQSTTKGAQMKSAVEGIELGERCRNLEESTRRSEYLRTVCIGRALGTR